jgi:hypothetical protein
MAQVRVYSCDDLPVWESYYYGLKARCIYGHPSYVAFLAGLYGDPAELFVYDEENCYVYYPYFKRALDKFALKIPDGIDLAGRVDFHSSWYYGGPLPSAIDLPSGFSMRFREAFADHARRCGCVTEFIRFDPNLENHRLYPAENVSFNRETVYVDLAGRTHDAVWQEFDSPGRRGINRARREGIVVVPRSPEEIDFWTRFAAIYADEMVRKNAPDRLRFDETFFHGLRMALPHNLCLMTAMMGEEMCGAHLIIFDETNAFIFLSATAFDSWGTRVNNLMFAEAIFWAQDHGKGRYDLQGGRPGVFRFKSHFSPKRGRFSTLNAVHDRALFELLVAHNRRPAGSGETAGERFPPYLP